MTSTERKPAENIPRAFRRAIQLAEALAVLMGLSYWQTVTNACRLLAAETTAAETALPEPGGLRQLPVPTNRPMPLINPDFEQQCDGWTPPDPEGFSIESQPGMCIRQGLFAFRLRPADAVTSLPCGRNFARSCPASTLAFLAQAGGRCRPDPAAIRRPREHRVPA